jgi:uncharacterized membrane protein
MKRKVLLAGESWISVANHYKGFDHFSSTTFHLGAEPFVAELERFGDFDVTYMKAHEVPDGFPFERADLDGYDAIILSDIGANSFLLPGKVWLHGKPMPNRLKLIRDWTADGGGLMMVGGYLTFQGIDGRARWHGTPVEAALPVTCLPHDDRIEVPEGFAAEIVQPGHPILEGVGADWPILLGANEIVARADAELIARLPEGLGGHPLLVAGRHGAGRTLAWASDIGPHWLPDAFSAWEGAGTLWRNMLKWLTNGAEGQGA